MSASSAGNVLWKVHSLFQAQFFTECDLVLPVSTSRIFSFPLRPCSSCIRLLPRLQALSIFPWITFSRRQFVLNMWPIQLAFLHFTVGWTFLSSLSLCNTPFIFRVIGPTDFYPSPAPISKYVSLHSEKWLKNELMWKSMEINDCSINRLSSKNMPEETKKKKNKQGFGTVRVPTHIRTEHKRKSSRSYVLVTSCYERASNMEYIISNFTTRFRNC